MDWDGTWSNQKGSLNGQRDGTKPISLRFGSNNGPIDEVAFATKAFNGKKIISISVNAKRPSGANTVVSYIVNGTSSAATELGTNFGDAAQTINLVANNDDANNVSIVFKNTSTAAKSNGGFQISSITVVYSDDNGGGETPVVIAAPSISCADNVVTITNNEEGASVYYTIDGTEPDANSTLYTAPFAITETCTVKAVAIKDGESSLPTTYTATFVAPAEVEPFTSSIAAVDDVITAARGTEITFTSLHAAKIAVEIDVEGHETTTTEVESDKFVYTVSEAAVISLTSYNVDGSEAHSAVYEIALEAAPLCGEVVFNPASGSAVIAGSEVTITCENAAVITYIIEINGELGDAIEVEGSEAKVVVTEACTIHADAKNIDGVPSEAAEASYTIAEAPAIGSAMFDFSDLEKTCELHSGINASDLPTATGSGINFSNYEGNFTNGVVTVSFSKGTNSSNDARWWYSKNGYHVRMYANNTVTVTVNPGCEITSIEFTQSGDNDWAMGAGAPAGTWSGKTWTPTPAASAVMREAAKGVESVTFTPTGKTFFATMNVNYEQPTVGVGNVVVDDANAPVEYYNLQGVRVENPANGLYIRRQGNNVSKVFVR